jgi:hypothetical protein
MQILSKQYMLNIKMLPLNIHSKWEKEVHMGVVIDVKSILFSDIKSFTKRTPFSQHILFIHILPPIWD